MSPSLTGTSTHWPIWNEPLPSAASFWTVISLSPGQTSTGGPSRSSRPNQPETVSDTVPLTLPDPLVPELRAQISLLETRLRTTQDELVAMAQRVGATESQVVALQAHAIEIRADRDAWRQQAERLATPTPVERRPWWRRLAG